MKKLNLNRIFNLLALLHDSQTIQAVYANWQGTDVRRQANAMEVMDQLLQGSLRSSMSKVMISKHSAVPALHPPLPLAKHLEWFFSQGDEWMRKVVQHQVHVKSGSRSLPQEDPVWRATRSSEDDQKQLSFQMKQMRLLRGVNLFKDLPGKDLASIALQLQEVTVPKGDEIIREDEMGDSLFIIQKGRAGVFRNAIPIGELGPGACFGEMAVLTHSLRTATVIAEEDLVLWSLDSNTFYELVFDRTSIALEIIRQLANRLRQMNARMTHHGIPTAPILPELAASSGKPELGPARSGDKKTAPAPSLPPQVNNATILRRVLVLQKISLFKNFSQEDFVRLAHRVEEAAYAPGEVIFRTGEVGNTLYGIIEGRVEVQRQGERLATLGEGQCFGEMALIDGEPRSADCLVTAPTVLLELSREQVYMFCFQRIDVLKSMMGVLAERLKDMQEKV